MPRARYKHVHIEMSRHGRRTYYYRAGNGHRIRLPDNYGSAEFVEAVRAAASSGISREREKYIQPSFAKTQQREVGLALQRILGGARMRARDRGLEFDLDREWALAQASAQNFKCSLTGVPFFMTTDARCSRHPYLPSIDRIDNQRGYTKDNVRIVVLAINVMLLDWGIDVFERVVNSYLYSKRTKPKLLFPTLGKQSGIGGELQQ